MEDDCPEPQRATVSSIGTIGFGTHRYKAAFSHVAPVSAAAAEHGGEKCMLGVSLGSANFEGARLEASIEWISERFERSAITIGDSVYRLTLQLLEGLTDEEARPRALAAGQAFARTYAPLIRQYGARCKFEYILFSDVEKQPTFPAHLAALEALATGDAGFARSIEAFADLYLGRGDKLEQNRFAVAEARAKEIAKSYLIEESALFCCLEEMGWPLLV